MRFFYLMNNTAFGLLIGFELGLGLAWIFSADIGDDVTKFYTYLIAASVSLIAATITLIGVFASIERANSAEAETRHRKLISARALLPTSLAKMCKICEAGMLYSNGFEKFLKDLGEAEFRATSLKELEVPSDVVAVFRDIIELSDDEAIRNRIAGVIREHQVHLARWSSEFTKNTGMLPKTKDELKQRTVGWAYLYAITVSLFGYGRGETEKLQNVDPHQLISSALNVRYHSSIFVEDFEEEVGLYARTFERRFK
ncbi:hypothetical protein GGR93_001007 [Sulfitobacter noctilucicola]|uniref:Uncharacterized protein n=2 Tax=Sulfitobacter noctilucicola TaxID=1342301 RepID=A0A7W6M6F1_9RHOB|nr:hypothetical protein [Sulfitobacter noctilucicola]